MFGLRKPREWQPKPIQKRSCPQLLSVSYIKVSLLCVGATIQYMTKFSIVQPVQLFFILRLRSYADDQMLFAQRTIQYPQCVRHLEVMVFLPHDLLYLRHVATKENDYSFAFPCDHAHVSRVQSSGQNRIHLFWSSFRQVHQCICIHLLYLFITVQ